MMKKWMLGIALLSTSLFTQATLINSEVNSIDMVGIEVTAIFAGGGTDTQTWSALPTISSTTGGVVTNGWSLTLDGNTFGDFDGSTNTFFGVWTLSNLGLSDDIIGLTVNAGIANIVFDIESGPLGSTPGSEAGRPFAALSAVASFSAPYSNSDLFGIMDVTGFTLAAGESLGFQTDTDKIEVPEPSTLFTFALGLIALTSLRKKSSGK